MPRSADTIAGAFAGTPGGRRRTDSEVRIVLRKKNDPSSNSSRSAESTRRSSRTRRISVHETEDGYEVREAQLIDILQDANMDGVRHLNSTNKCVKMTWCAVILLFLLLALFQIYRQVQLYYQNPIATNIEAEYPSKIAFPTVAICNNNQFRLSYITGSRVLKRTPRVKLYRDDRGNDSNVFEEVVKRNWDIDAVKFMRNAAHWKSRMILKCNWPNGTSCRLSDFRAVWTMTGLCWAINTDPMDPVYVTGSGAGHGLRLLLNVESYERVEACTPQFKTKSLSGVKILIYNQTDVPESSLNGVNVPSGYSMDIPFKMQHRHKIAGANCVTEEEEHVKARNDFDSEKNVRTCTLRGYMRQIEDKCGCSLRKAYNPNPREDYPFCNVDQYFSCVQGVLEKVRETGAANGCLPPCESIDYTAWQDMNVLPASIMPALIDEKEDDDENDVGEEFLEEDVYKDIDGEEHYECAENKYLDDSKIRRIKHEAQLAYEKQSRFQEDIVLRNRRLIGKLFNATERLQSLGWGWNATTFQPTFERLRQEVDCFANFSSRHEKVTSAILAAEKKSEERRAAIMQKLLSPNSIPRLLTVADVKSAHGDKADQVGELIKLVQSAVESTFSLYQEDTYSGGIEKDLGRMDRILELAGQYEGGRLQRKAWADKMQSRKMRGFFHEEFAKSWYDPIMQDLDETLSSVIYANEEEWKRIEERMEKGGGEVERTGALLYLGEASEDNEKLFREFLEDLRSCTSGDLRAESEHLLKTFKHAHRELTSAYNNLYVREMKHYMDRFEFGAQFVRENFAQVNVFLHKMHLEHWIQQNTYSIWSLACDIGGALGLFLGASLLTVIELVYLAIQHGACENLGARTRMCWSDRKKHARSWFSCGGEDGERGRGERGRGQKKSEADGKSVSSKISYNTNKEVADLIDLKGQTQPKSTPQTPKAVHKTSKRAPFLSHNSSGGSTESLLDRAHTPGQRNELLHEMTGPKKSIWYEDETGEDGRGGARPRSRSRGSIVSRKSDRRADGGPRTSRNRSIRSKGRPAPDYQPLVNDADGDTNDLWSTDEESPQRRGRKERRLPRMGLRADRPQTTGDLAGMDKESSIPHNNSLPTRPEEAVMDGEEWPLTHPPQARPLNKSTPERPTHLGMEQKEKREEPRPVFSSRGPSGDSPMTAIPMDPLLQQEPSFPTAVRSPIDGVIAEEDNNNSKSEGVDEEEPTVSEDLSSSRLLFQSKPPKHKHSDV